MVIVAPTPLGLELGDDDELEDGDDETDAEGEEDELADGEEDGEGLEEGLLDGDDDTDDDGELLTDEDGEDETDDDGLGLLDGDELAELDGDEEGDDDTLLDGDGELEGLELADEEGEEEGEGELDGELEADDDGDDEGEGELDGDDDALLDGEELADDEGLDEPAAAAGANATVPATQFSARATDQTPVPEEPALACSIDAIASSGRPPLSGSSFHSSVWLEGTVTGSYGDEDWSRATKRHTNVSATVVVTLGHVGAVELPVLGVAATSTMSEESPPVILPILPEHLGVPEEKLTV